MSEAERTSELLVAAYTHGGIRKFVESIDQLDESDVHAALIFAVSNEARFRLVEAGK